MPPYPTLPRRPRLDAGYGRPALCCPSPEEHASRFLVVKAARALEEPGELLKTDPPCLAVTAARASILAPRSAAYFYRHSAWLTIACGYRRVPGQGALLLKFSKPQQSPRL